MAMFKSYVKLPEGNMLSNVTLHLCKLEEHIQFRLNWHGSRMLWNCRHFSMCSENVHAKHRGWAWHPEQTSSASVGCSWWLFSDKTWRYPEENWWNIFSNHKKKQHYMKFIFNQRSRKNTQLNHSEVCFFYQHRPSQCTTRIASLLQRCGLVPPAASWTDLNRAARSYHRTSGIWPSGKHTKSYWKLPFIVDLPIKNSDFP